MGKDKNYNSTRGVGDGNLTTGLLGMMQGGGAMEYPEMMMNGGSSGSMTYAQKAKYGKEKMKYGGNKGDMSMSKRDY
jgi:hypothetical protein